MIEPKLELKKVTNQLNRLELVKARAIMRTKRRIAEQIENEELQKLAEGLATVEPKDAYTATVIANGNTQYRKNGKLISQAEYETNK